MMAKENFLYFYAPNRARLIKRDVKNGAVDIDDNLMDVTGYTPIQLDGKFGSSNLYLVRWDSVHPSQRMDVIMPGFVPDPDMTPEMWKKLSGMKVLGNMLKIQKPPMNWIVLMLLGIAFGAFITYYVITMKLVKI